MTALETKSSRDLFKSSSQGESGVRNRRDKEQMVTDYSNVTNSLMAISRQLADTVERSKQTVTSLEGTSKTVEELGDEYRMMGGVIGQSRKLITKYARREFTDKVTASTHYDASKIMLMFFLDPDSICSRIFLCRSPLYFKEKTVSNIRSIRGKILQYILRFYIILTWPGYFLSAGTVRKRSLIDYQSVELKKEF